VFVLWEFCNRYVSATLHPRGNGAGAITIDGADSDDFMLHGTDRAADDDAGTSEGESDDEQLFERAFMQDKARQAQYSRVLVPTQSSQSQKKESGTSRHRQLDHHHHHPQQQQQQHQQQRELSLHNADGHHDDDNDDDNNDENNEDKNNNNHNREDDEGVGHGQYQQHSQSLNRTGSGGSGASGGGKDGDRHKAGSTVEPLAHWFGAQHGDQLLLQRQAGAALQQQQQHQQQQHQHQHQHQHFIPSAISEAASRGDGIGIGGGGGGGVDLEDLDRKLSEDAEWWKHIAETTRQLADVDDE
jgi:hypothetical protein